MYQYFMEYNMTITTQSGTNLYVSPINIHVIDDEFWMTYIKDNLIDAIKFEDIAQLNETSINYTFADMTIKTLYSVETYCQKLTLIDSVIIFLIVISANV